jgi:hypothetical protein
MRNDYKHLYGPVQVPSVRTIVTYADPLRTDEERRATASRIAKQQAKLRRAKIGERWIVFTVASMMAIAMLPVVVVVGAILLARALWRRYTQGRERQGTSATTDETRMSEGVSCRRGSNNPPGTATRDLAILSVGKACAA